jgi:hypothetical protein
MLMRRWLRNLMDAAEEVYSRGGGVEHITSDVPVQHACVVWDGESLKVVEAEVTDTLAETPPRPK